MFGAKGLLLKKLELCMPKLLHPPSNHIQVFQTLKQTLCGFWHYSDTAGPVRFVSHLSCSDFKLKVTISDLRLKCTLWLPQKQQARVQWLGRGRQNIEKRLHLQAFDVYYSFTTTQKRNSRLYFTTALDIFASDLRTTGTLVTFWGKEPHINYMNQPNYMKTHNLIIKIQSALDSGKSVQSRSREMPVWNKQCCEENISHPASFLFRNDLSMQFAQCS